MRQTCEAWTETSGRGSRLGPEPHMIFFLLCSCPLMFLNSACRHFPLFFLVTNSTCTEYWFSDSVWLGIYPCDMEVLPLLTFSRTNIRLLLPHLPWLFPSWHPNWFTCPLANLSQARRPSLPPPRSPPFLQTNYRLLRRDFTLWHPGDLPILRLLRPPDKSLRIRSRSLPEKQTLRLQCVCVCACVWHCTHTHCVCVQHLNRCKTSTVWIRWFKKGGQSYA